MAIMQRSAHVPYEADQMLALVNDITAYPEFLHWCHAARIDTVADTTVEATLEIGLSGIYKSIRTRNRTRNSNAGSPARIEIEMLEGPLKKLRGSWVFSKQPSTGCDVELRLEYEIHRSPFGLVLRTVFDEIANSQLNAFVKRAGVVYGDK